MTIMRDCPKDANPPRAASDGTIFFHLSDFRVLGMLVDGEPPVMKRCVVVGGV